MRMYMFRIHTIANVMKWWLDMMECDTNHRRPVANKIVLPTTNVSFNIVVVQ